MTVLGAQYYRPPNPPREDWARDLRRMRDVGMNTVKFWACWSWMEPHKGSIDFDDLDGLMDVAGSVGLSVVINVILENAPYWLDAAVPEARYTDHEGHAFQLTAARNTPGGGWPGLCFDHPVVWAAAAEFMSSLVERYRGHPALRVWDVWNEPHLEPASYAPERLYCYCPASLEAFMSWLHARHGDLHSLNQAWARRYGDWSEVAPPRVFEAVPDMLDWREFWFTNLRRWLARRVDVLRASDPDHPAMTHVALSGFTGQLATHVLDEFTLGESVDLFGTSSFPTWLMEGDLVEHLFNLEAVRDAAPGKPIWQAELQGGRGPRDVRNQTRHPRPEEMTLWMWNALAAGASGIMYWQWRPELLGPESPGSGLCTPSGEPTDRLRAVEAFSAIAGVPELVGRRSDDPAIGLLVSRRAALFAFASDRRMEIYRDAVLGAYRLLLDLDLSVRFVHEDLIEQAGVPTRLDRLYWPMPTIASPRLAAALAEFATRGGRLLAEALPGEYGPNGRRQAVVPGFGMDALFGVSEIESDADRDAELHLASGRILHGAWQRVAVRVPDAVVIGAFGDGSPAVTLREVGRGAAIHVATYPSLAYQRARNPNGREAMSELLGVEDLVRPVQWTTPSPGLLGRAATFRDRNRIRFALNWTTTDAQAVSQFDALLFRIGPAPRRGESLMRGATFVVPARSGVLLAETVDRSHSRHR
jgi:beta-galactosidase GanA